MAFLPACSEGLGGHRDGALGEGYKISVVEIGESGTGNYLAGRFALDQHDLSAASDFLLKALNRDPENLELLQRSLLALAAEGRMDDAADIARRLLSFDADAALAAMILASQDARQGRWEMAEKRVARLPRRGINAFMAPVIIAWTRAGQGNISAAIEALAPLSQTSSFATLHDFHAALIADMANRRKLADGYYRSMLAGDSGQTLRSIQAATAFYRRIGQAKIADEIAARYYLYRNDPFEEKDGGPPVKTATDGLAEAFLSTASSWRQGNLPELSLVFARMALSLKPDFSLAWLSVGETLQSLDRLEEADQAFAEIGPDSPVYWNAQLRIATNMDQTGDFDGAVRTLEALAARDPGRPESLVTLGDIYRRHERWQDAAAAYDRALAMSPQDSPDLWGLYYSRGIALERSKRWPEAERDLLKALELRPDEPHVLNYLGYSWIEQGEDIDRARKMIERAVELRPTDGYIVDSLGWAYYRTGDYAKAVDILERAVELHPEEPTINDHLGDALWDVGRRNEAFFQWQRALTFKPDSDIAEEIRRKIAERTPPAPETETAPKAAVTPEAEPIPAPQ